MQAKYRDHYRGGILAIDELAATICPGSQIKLLEALRSFAVKFKLQVIFTTHSLTLLERACAIQEVNASIPSARNHIKVVDLEKLNRDVKIIENVTCNSIVHRLNVPVDGERPIKISASTEDKEGEIFAPY